MKENNECFWLVGKNHLNLSKTACRQLGLTVAVMLCQLLELEELAHSEIGNDKLISHPKYGDGWFCAKIDTIQCNTGLSKNEQSTAIKNLLALKFIDMAKFGLPTKRHFKIDQEKIFGFFGGKL